MCDSDTEHPLVTDRPRKKRKKVFARENAKIKRLSNFTEGRESQCKIHKCVFNVTLEKRKALRTTLQNCKYKNKHDALITTCVTVQSNTTTSLFKQTDFSTLLSIREYTNFLPS